MTDPRIRERAAEVAIGMLATRDNEERQRLTLAAIEGLPLGDAVDVFEVVTRILADAFISAAGDVLSPARVAELRHDAMFWAIAQEYDEDGEDG
ncbi:hypothetical protein [Leifsonia sp. WHRI 6310E]|uniref:hypothetical protein n=1 Tax=Leifsonia sp. WHRI 6310E TaxID=3162562 RepID=UPI0032EC8FF2